MKQKDIVLIIVIIFVSAVLSLLITGKFISTPKNRSQSVEVVTPINGDPNSFKLDDNYFNDKAIDPTKNITIGGSNNPQPFNQ